MNVKSHLWLMHAARKHLDETEGAFITTASLAGVSHSGSSLVGFSSPPGKDEAFISLEKWKPKVHADKPTSICHRLIPSPRPRRFIWSRHWPTWRRPRFASTASRLGFSSRYDFSFSRLFFFAGIFLLTFSETGVG